MTLVFLNVERVEQLHTQQIEKFGGSRGLRDPGLLQSAVLRAESKAHYEPDSTIAQIAASLAWGLIKNHAFIDGNKRIGFVAMVTFLELNGYEMTCPEAEETTVVLRVAASEMDEAEWTAWVERVVAPLRG